MAGWGLDFWGLDQWGTPTLHVPQGGTPPTILVTGTYVLEVEGGTLITIIGDGFFPEFVPRVLSGPHLGPYELAAVGYLFDPEYDLIPSRAITGMPALPEGVYHLQVQTPGGLSNVIESVLEYKPFAHREKAQKGRSSWSQKWAVGARLGA